jgi:PAS domain S-box-containing protein
MDGEVSLNKQTREELMRLLEKLRMENESLQIALSESQGKYNRILENLKGEYFFYAHDIEGKFTFVSNSIKDILGFTPDEFLKNFDEDLSPHPINESARRHTRLSIQGIRQPPYELEVYHKDGSCRWITTIEIPIFDSQGRVVAVEGVSRDITEKKVVEEKLEKYRMQLEELVQQRTAELTASQKQLSALMSNLPGMAYRIVLKGQWIIEFVSEGCRQLFGHSPTDFIGRELKSFSHLIHPDDLGKIIDIIQPASEGQPFQTEYRIITANGEERWVFDKAEAGFTPEGAIKSLDGFITDFTLYKKMEEKLRNENILLRSTIRDRYKFDKIIGNSQVMQDVYDLILKAAVTDESVFIFGESGTGKELAAQAIHRAGRRANNPFVAVNCGAIPENLIESEFFGYRRGAFSGAVEDKKGHLEAASGGTLFLDEIGEISPGIQVKLLRAIEGGGFSPLGSRRVITPDFRMVAASNKNIADLVKQGRMREDFFFRIHVIPIHLPPLRDRGDDLYLLIDHFLKIYSKTEKLTTLRKEDLALLKNYHWPGNVRELQNALRRFVMFKNFDFMRFPNIIKPKGSVASTEKGQGMSQTLNEGLEQFEKSFILRILEQNQWQKGKTARDLGICRKTLYSKMKIYELL